MSAEFELRRPSLLLRVSRGADVQVLAQLRCVSSSPQPAGGTRLLPPPAACRRLLPLIPVAAWRPLLPQRHAVLPADIRPAVGMARLAVLTALLLLGLWLASAPAAADGTRCKWSQGAGTGACRRVDNPEHLCHARLYASCPQCAGLRVQQWRATAQRQIAEQAAAPALAALTSALVAAAAQQNDPDLSPADMQQMLDDSRQPLQIAASSLLRIMSSISSRIAELVGPELAPQVRVAGLCCFGPYSCMLSTSLRGLQLAPQPVRLEA